jgi:hypothetical protein
MAEVMTVVPTTYGIQVWILPVPADFRGGMRSLFSRVTGALRSVTHCRRKRP